MERLLVWAGLGGAPHCPLSGGSLGGSHWRPGAQRLGHGNSHSWGHSQDPPYRLPPGCSLSAEAVQQGAIYLPMDTGVVPICLVLWIMMLWALVYNIWIPAFNSLGYIPRNGRAGSHVTFWKTTKLFFSGTAPFYIPKNNAWKWWWFLHILVHIYNFLFIISRSCAILVGMKWYLVVSTCISLMTNHV